MRPEFLKSLATYVAGLAGRPIATNRPVIGEEIFTCETGLHLQGLQNKPQTYEPFAPERVQAERRLLFGAKSGRRAILQRLAKLSGTQETILTDQTFTAVRNQATRLGRPLSDTELITLLRSSS